MIIIIVGVVVSSSSISYPGLLFML